GGTECGGGPKGQREVVGERRHPGRRSVVGVQHLREHERRVSIRVVSAGGGTAAVEIPVPEAALTAGEAKARNHAAAWLPSPARLQESPLVIGRWYALMARDSSGIRPVAARSLGSYGPGNFTQSVPEKGLQAPASLQPWLPAEPFRIGPGVADAEFHA